MAIEYDFQPLSSGVAGISNNETVAVNQFIQQSRPLVFQQVSYGNYKSFDPNYSQSDAPPPNYIPYTGWPATAATGVSDSGIVGTFSYGPYYNGPAAPSAYLYQTSTRTFTNINLPGYYATNPESVNDALDVAGYYIPTSGGSTLGYIDIGGVVTTIGTNIVAINNNDDYAGYDSNGAFESIGGTVTYINVPGSLQTVIAGMNDSGDIAGSYIGADGQYHGFVYQDGQYQTVDYPGTSGGTRLLGINSADEIVGTSPTGGDFFASTDEVPCYCRGTRILTENGEVAVEDLKIGDSVITGSCNVRQIRWIGTRSYAGRFAGHNRDVLPVLIRAGAFADNLPKRDLMVSPLHAMYLDTALIPAVCLVNGHSIIQLEAVEQVDYFHIELDSHDVIFAEGALSETFVNDDSRGIFHNAASYRETYPDAEELPARYCAPRLEGGAELQEIHQRLLTRAQAAQWVQTTRHAA
jgi:hypothetical protein